MRLGISVYVFNSLSYQFGFVYYLELPVVSINEVVDDVFGESDFTNYLIVVD